MTESQPVRELEAEPLAARIALRAQQPEFVQAGIAPTVSPEEAAETLRTRLRDLLPAVASGRDSLDRVEARRRRAQRQVRGFLVPVAGLGLAILLLGVLDALTRHFVWLDVSNFYGLWHTSLTDGDVIGYGLLVVFLASLALVLLLFFSGALTVLPGLRSRELQLTQQLETRLDFEVDRILRLTAIETGEQEGKLALPPEAPDLVEVATAEMSETPNIERLRRLVMYSSTSAFAVAGPRGIGKSTLIRALTTDPDLFEAAAVVPAPVRYDPDSLLRRIQSELALAILREHGAEDVLSELRQSAAQRARVRRLLLAATVGVFGMSFIFAGAFLNSRVFSLGSIGGLGGILLVCAVGVLITTFEPQTALLRTRRYSPVVNNAVAALQQLRFATETTSTAKTTFGMAKLPFGAEDSDASTQKERDRSRPELVADLLAFIERHMALSRRAARGDEVELPALGERRRPLAIAVDELDKMAEPEEILATINSLKDLFRIPDVHFLVSVSDDAINRFSLRGVVSRDAFDSSFDGVIELARLTAAESHEILAARAIGFPRRLSAFAHAWSGGLPRDLIRVARRCVELRRDLGQQTIEQLTGAVIAEDLALALIALRAAEHQALTAAGTSRSQASELTGLIDALTRTSADARSIGLLRATIDERRPDFEGVDPSVRNAAIKVVTAAEISGTFASALSAGRFPEPEPIADDLAALTAALSVPLGEFMVVADRAKEQLEEAGVVAGVR